MRTKLIIHLVALLATESASASALASAVDFAARQDAKSPKKRHPMAQAGFGSYAHIRNHKAPKAATTFRRRGAVKRA